jgi:RNA polymerase sigma-70 factor (ECF subfamily)
VDQPIIKRDELLPTRQSLLSRLKNLDDSRTWQDFFDTYSTLIYNVAIKSGLNDAEAKDALQETVLSVAKNIKDFKYDSSRSFKAWLLQATRWRINDQFRKRLPVARKTRRRDDETVRTDTVERIPNPSGYDLEAKWDFEWREHLQQTALHRLRVRGNAKHYQIFDAFVIKGWPLGKVMATLGVSEDQVYKVKSRIVTALTKEVSRIERNIT